MFGGDFQMSILDLQALETTAAEALVPGSTVSTNC
ncbi:SapB/AmfS family lanthipeptide [Saccharopolyspora sp. NPDC002376]